MSAPRTVLIVRLGSLGDLVHALPAVAWLRHHWPETRIDWLVEPPYAALVQLMTPVSHAVTLRGRSIGGWLATRSELRARRYDMAIDLQGLVKSAALARLSGATRVVGFDTPSLRESAARVFYTEQMQVGEGGHVINKNLLMARSLSSPGVEPDPQTAAVVFPWALGHSAAVDQLRAAGVGAFVLLNPGAAWPNKRWPSERFAAVARWVLATYGLTSVVLWGPGEQTMAQTVVDQSAGAALLAPATTFHDVLCLARDARLMVSGDTGPVHLAASVACPVVAVFGPTTPQRNGPWDDRDVSISKYELCRCHYQRTCAQPDRWCLSAITVDEVTAAIAERMARA